MNPALERRYNGPIPAGAAIHADASEPWAVQLSNRRDLAWLSVRRRGHDIVRAKRLWNQFHAMHVEKEIRRLLDPKHNSSISRIAEALTHFQVRLQVSMEAA